ncbi:DHA2 family efflux MFS transporter permease subunit [Dysgonomonas sp. 216]|nr:DHA2 family efflux MFS transporter permease subunit [Dysgonomonas sp. 216]
MAMFMQALDSTILNTALPAMAADLGRSPLSMQSVIIAYTLTLALLIPISGWLADKYGTRRIFSLAVGLFTLGSLACALSDDINLLVCSRILQAIGGSMMVPVSRLALIYAYPKDQLLKVINFVTMPALVGPVVGPLLGGWIVQIASWHWIFLVNIPIGIAGIVFAQKVMPDFKREPKSLDILGFIFISCGLILLSMGLELGGEGAISLTFLFVLVFIASVFFAVYVFYAKKKTNPLFSLDLFKIRTLRIGLLGNLFTRLGVGGLPLLLPLMLQVAFLHSPSVSGMMLMPAAITAIVAKSWIVPLVRRFGYKKLLIANTLALAVVISLFALPDKTTPLLLLVPLLIIYGCINSFQMTSMNTITLADLDDNTASEGNSLQTVMQQLSMSFGISVSMMILRGIENTECLTDGNTELAFKYTFIVLGIITTLASIIFLNLKKGDGDKISGRKSKNE